MFSNVVNIVTRAKTLTGFCGMKRNEMLAQT